MIHENVKATLRAKSGNLGEVSHCRWQSSEKHHAHKSLIDTISHEFKVGEDTFSEIGDSSKGQGGSASECARLGINPFEHYSETDIEPYIDSFLNRQNHVLYLFKKDELMTSFRLACISTGAKVHREVMFETCLCLSIGCQLSDTGCDDTSVLWYEKGRRFLVARNWVQEPRIMRARCLIQY
jgi:hypothetical protein